MKQPILFQSRVIDLAEIFSKLTERPGTEGIVISTPAYTLYEYYTSLGSKCKKAFCELMQSEYGITFEKWHYMSLARPYIVDLENGNIVPAINIDYMLDGRLHQVIGGVDNGEGGIKFTYLTSKGSPLASLSHHKVTDIAILHDGWVLNE